MNRHRLELALERLRGSDWARFEQFASEFLSAEMEDIRTVATPAGDAGRDAELFAPHGDAKHVLQYSVAGDWRNKILDTASRIAETLPGARVLTYATNQVIGPRADDDRKMLRERFDLHLDIRDRSYFLDRCNRDHAVEVASESLAQDIADPYLSSRGVIEQRASALGTHEAKAAHVYLSLQSRDDLREKGLTKLTFEALVRAVLVDTDSDNRLPRSDVLCRVRQLVPATQPDHVDQLTNAALTRLTKKAIRHWPQLDEFCLSYQERLRVTEYLAELELVESALMSELQSRLAAAQPAMSEAKRGDAAVRIRRVLEKCLYDRSEAFSAAVTTGDITRLATDHFRDVILEDLRVDPPPRGSVESDPEWLDRQVREVLLAQEPAIQEHCVYLSEAYTLMAFLRETPDVQRATQKMFSHGDIWVDTSAVLPLLSEELLDDDSGQFQRMVHAASNAGLHFFATRGVVEEIERHINRAMTCARKGLTQWEGRTPFLLEAYLQEGAPLTEFASWTEYFRGPSRPVEDVALYLRERHQIECQDLDPDLSGSAIELRQIVQEIWHGIHTKRRERSGSRIDDIVIGRLSNHDAENYAGVIHRRAQERDSPFGYTAWWLTLDRSAFSVRSALIDQGLQPPDSPVLSMDFFSQYLSFGPLRARVHAAGGRMLPIVFEPRLVRFLTPELLDEAARVREGMKGVPERVIRRRIRDLLDAARQRVGPLAKLGLEGFLADRTP